MTTPWTYECSECHKVEPVMTRGVDGATSDGPRWWSNTKMCCGNTEEGKTSLLCSPRCLKIWADRIYSLAQPWHFFVRTESHPPRGFLLCVPMNEFEDTYTGGVTHPKTTSVKEDVTCSECAKILQEESK